MMPREKFGWLHLQSTLIPASTGPHQNIALAGATELHRDPVTDADSSGFLNGTPPES